MGDCQQCDLRVEFDCTVGLTFVGSKVTSDAGLLAYRELDEALGLTATAGKRLEGSRTGRNTRHALLPLIRQSIYSRPAGCGQTACCTSWMKCRERSSREKRRFSSGQRPGMDFGHGLSATLAQAGWRSRVLAYERGRLCNHGEKRPESHDQNGPNAPSNRTRPPPVDGMAAG
jgi:hypothetical protein